MTVVVAGNMVLLTGRCGAEDAETLLVALQDGKVEAVDLSGAQRLHMAVAQILLAARPPIAGVPDNEFLSERLIGLMRP